MKQSVEATADGGRRFWIGWGVAFLGFPLGGAAAAVLVGAITTPLAGALGGAVTGAVIGAAAVAGAPPPAAADTSLDRSDGARDGRRAGAEHRAARDGDRRASRCRCVG